MKKRWFFQFLGLGCIVFLSLYARVHVAETLLKHNQPQASYRILITHKYGTGEREMAERIQRTATKMGIDSSVLSLARISRFRSVFDQINTYFVNALQPDFIISLEGGRHLFANTRKYVAMTHASDYYFSQHPKLCFDRLSHYDGYLVSFPDRGTLKSYFALTNKYCNYLSWYMTCPELPFKQPKGFDLFYCGSNMSQTTSGQIVKTVFSMLDQTGFFRVFGDKKLWEHTPKSYRGYIPHDGESILHAINQAGVALVLHSPDHFLGNTPSSRIFESAAASAVIISDKHPFIVENFGDSVLYVDNTSAKEMFEQIVVHMEWIRANPEKAIELARKSHQIFLERFTLEKQLQALINMHENLVIEKYSVPKEKRAAI